MTGPTSTRWTHIALPCASVEASIQWYEAHTPLRLLDRRQDEEGAGAWLGHDDQPDHPFILVLIQKHANPSPGPRLAPFAHLGFEVPRREEVDAIAARARNEGYLVWEPVDHDPPVGYVCAISDPDGNLVEFSHDQGVYRAARERWGR